MTIEQMLIRPMKSSGGLWILCSISLINVVDLMKNFCNVQYQTSEQHVDKSNARISRDASDIK